MVRLKATTARRWLCLLSASCCLLAAGCHNGKQLQADLYQRELRLQEDEIYRLEDYIDQYQSIIRGYRCEVAELKQELAERAPEPVPERSVEADRRRKRDRSVLDDPAPSVAPLGEVEDTLPPGDLPLDGPSVDEAPPFDPEAAADNPSLEPAPLFDGSAVDSASPIDSVVEAPAEEAPQELAAASYDESSPPNPYPVAAPGGDEPNPFPAPLVAENVVLHAKPYDASSIVAVVSESEFDALAGFDGEASVMLIDPRLEGRLKRVARWDFTPEEVAQGRIVSQDGATTRLELPVALPADTPVEAELQLWVRLLSPTGEKVLESTEVRFASSPLRLVSAAEPEPLLGASLRRLPPIVLGGETSLADRDPDLGLQWLPAGPGRRIDSAVTPAGYTAE